MGKIQKINKVINFIEYITKNMEKKDLFLLYKINNIKKEKLELYLDFVFSLNKLIIDTYLGDDITNEGDKLSHFKWCWNNVVSSFKKEGIYFVDTDELFIYFLTFYQESFYNEIKIDELSSKFSHFWSDLLDYEKSKTMSEYESMLEIYKIFNKSFVVN
jgi:hypothetical protein